MSGAARAAAVALLLAGAAWWGWSAWSGAPAPSLRRPDGARASDVVTAATAPDAVEAGSDATPTETPSAIAAVRGETRRAAALVDLDAPPGPRKPFVLHVVDATTKRELREVTVRSRRSVRLPIEVEWPANRELHFAPLAQGDSPLTLPPPEGAARVDELDVACAGHQPRRLVVEWTGGGERRIELLRGGTLRLAVRDAPSSAQLEAHLVDGDQSPLIGMGSATAARIASAEGAAFAPIELLSAGRWRVELYDRGAAGDPQVGGGEAVVVADAETKVELDYVARPLQPLVPIAGRVVIDRAWFDGASEPPTPPRRLAFWQEGRPSVRRSPAQWDVELETPSEPSSIPFDGGLALPGLLLVIVDDWECTALLEVPEQGSRELEVAVPPPADVVVTVRDALTATPLEGIGLLASGNAVKRWRSRYVVAPLAWMRSLGTSGADGRVEFRMTAGEAHLGVKGEGGRSWDFQFAPGQNAVEMSLGAFATLRVQLRDGDAIVPWGEGAFAIVESGGRRCFSREARMLEGDPAGTLLLDADGPVLVSVDGLAGYEASERFDVSLVRGTPTSIEIPLRRRN